MKKKRIISLLLALLMGLGMFPSAAFATEAAPCAVCGAADCHIEHVQCATCGEYDCSVDHSAAPTEEPVVCAVCNTENCETKHLYCTVCAGYDCGLDHEDELCPVCKAANCELEHIQCATCGEYDCTIDHTATTQTPAAPTVDYSGDVGMYATLNPYFAEGYVEVFDGAQIYTLPYSDFAEGLVLTVADWHYDAGTGYLWYQVYVTVGELPASMADGWWIHQATAADNAEEKTLILTSPLATADETGDGIVTDDTTTPDDTTTEGGDDTTTTPNDSTVTEPVICPVCSAENCTEHVPCAVCGEYNCSTQHVQCDICQNYDCTVQHVYCDICQIYDCGITHLWCETCQIYDCGKTHQPCPVCSTVDCTEHVLCEICGEYNCVTQHVQCTTCGTYDCVTDHATGAAAIYSGVVGKYAAIALTSEEDYIYVAGTENISEDGAVFFYNYEFKDNTVFKIDGWYYEEENGAVWYKVSFVSGGVLDDVAEFWPAEAWILHDYYDLTGTDEYPATLTVVDVSFCPTCGGMNCTMSHFYCEVCASYTCTATHLYCNACNIYDCPLEHTFCYDHDKYDCTETHQTVAKPITAPIVVAPNGNNGDVTIGDRYGNVVTSLVLSGMRDTLSAWGAYADYQWQVCYDAANDLWADIQGQSAQGIVLSPAMFLGAFSGEAYLRCRSGSGEAATYSAPVAVSFAAPAAETFRETVGTMLPQAEGGTDADKQYVVVQYLYTDGRIAAGNRVYELQLDSGLTDTHTIPSIPGYKATLDSTFDNKVKLEGNSLSLNFPADSFLSNPTTITVRYEVDYVNYTVIHYLQNVNDDNYTELTREVKRDKKTGEIIDTAHNTYPGFFNLLYETPAAAADGSTVIEVYYDRYYYLMTFDMGTGGYGTDPIYARYGDTVVAENPTRPGYTFLGWSLDGSTVVDLPGTMPPENRQYIAVWDETDLAKVSIVVWGENADDEEYSYLKTMEMSVKPGTTFTYSEDGALICGIETHTHSASCNYACGKAEHSHDRNCYTLTCTIPIHTHSDACYTCGAENHNHNTGCYANVGAAFSGSIGEWGVTGTESNGSIGESYHIFNTGTKYIYINGTWYRYTGNAEVGSTVQPNCGKEESTHTHTDACLGCGFAEHTHTDYTGSCYTLTCTQEEHSHSDACGYACGKTAHTHSSSCYMEGAGMESDLWTFVRSDTVTVEANGSTVMNVYFDRTQKTLTYKYNYSNRNYQTTKTITAKWGANISTAYEAIAADAGTTFWTKDSDGNKGPYTNYFGIMPQASATYYTRISSNDTGTMTYYGETLTSGEYKEMFSVGGVGGYSVTVEDRYEFLGFTYDHGTSTGSSCSGATFYYTRNSYKLDFNNGVEVTKSESVKYQAPLDAYDTYEPPVPNIYEPGSVTFGGWYLNPQCSDGAEFEPIGKFMPAENLIVYAKWEKVEHEVNYFMTKESYDRGETIPAEMSRLVDEAVANGAARPETDPYTTVFATVGVEHGEKISNPSDPGVSKGYEKIHPRAGYTFVGWFYINDEGKETAFDPENMPVDRDLDLYAKWSANKLCQYNIYFALDENADGIADTDENGNIIYVAEPLTGSGIAGHTYTFTAKGEADLYDAYDEGYFPNVGSHSIAIDILDEEGTGPNSFTFLYRPKAAVPYTVKYLDKATGAPVAKEKEVKDNKNIVVTETFVPVNGYMPDAYQKTLVVSAEDGAVNEIIFWYTEDELHSIYVVNHYVEVVDSENNHIGWTKYTSFQNTGDIGKTYEGTAMDINGYSLSVSYTNQYNTVDKKNGETEAALPTAVSVLYESNTKINGVLEKQGMELNFYYVRNLYPYEFRFVLKDVGTQLATPEVGKAPYDTYITQQAKEIKLDLDGDGILEEYRLYDATETEKEIHIIPDGEPLAADAVVTVGMATVNIATFEYIRCTQDISVKKIVEDKGTDSHPDPDQLYHFELKVHIKDGYHKSSYTTILDDNSSSTISPELTRPDTICFSLKANENFTIEGLPTAQYTLTELPLPLGFTEPEYQYTIGETVNTAADGSGVTGETYSGNSAVLQVEHPLHFTVTNTYDPAALEISKTINVVETDLNTPEISEFVITVEFPDGVELEESYAYSLNDSSATQTEEVDFTKRTMTLTLKNGDKVRFPNLPTGAYTVIEDDYSASGYKSFVKIDSEEDEESRSASVQLVNGETRSVAYTNRFPVGDLDIQKTVTKEFYNTPWAGDTFTFTFTVQRTTAGRPLIVNNQYLVYEGETRIGTATVASDNTLTVEITFGETDVEALKVKGASAAHSYTIKNLPAGTYSVVENKVEGYEQSASGNVVADGSTPTVTGIEIPASTTPKAEFANKLIRPTGKMNLQKLLHAASGFNENELPEGTEFEFTIRLTEDAPESVNVKQTLKADPASDPAVADVVSTVTMDKGSFEVRMKANETIIFEGLPIGVYRVIEHSQPSYANTFEIKNEDDQWVRQPATSEGENLYTEIEVKADDTAEVNCVNIYPVRRGELMIRKDFTKEYERDELPANLSSDFKISFEEQDASEYYYTVFENGSIVAGSENVTATVTEETVDGDTDYCITINLKDGQYAVITGGKAINDNSNLTGVPVCGFTVTETKINSTDTGIDFDDFNVSYEMYRSEMASPAAEGDEVPAQLSGTGTVLTDSILAGYIHAVIFTNEYKQQLTDLTITKSGTQGTDENQSFIFTVNGPDVRNLKVVINGDNSVTIRDLPLGDYTVTEDSNWSWRYTPTVGTQTITLDPDASKNHLTFNNDRTQPYWLSGDSINENQFTVNVPTTTN